jgi:hypothetical protein
LLHRGEARVAALCIQQLGDRTRVKAELCQLGSLTPPTTYSLPEPSRCSYDMYRPDVRQNCYFNITNAVTHFSSARTGRNQIRSCRCHGSLLGLITQRGNKVNVEFNLLAVHNFSVCLKFLKSSLWTSNIMLKFQELGT